jgi:hypothetical protein
MRVTVIVGTTTMMEPDRRGRPDGTLRKVIANAAADHNVLQPKRIDPSERFIQHVRREVRAVAALLDRVFRNPSSQIRIVDTLCLRVLFVLKVIQFGMQLIQERQQSLVNRSDRNTDTLSDAL